MVLESIKKKIMGTEGVVCFSEDVEKVIAEKLMKSYGGTELKDKDLEKHVSINFSFLDYAKPERNYIEVKEESVVCGFCGQKNDIFLTLKEQPLKFFAAPIFELFETAEYLFNRQKIDDKIQKREIDVFTALLQIKALNQAHIKKGQDETGKVKLYGLKLTDRVSDIIDFKCEKCHRIMGKFQYEVKLKDLLDGREWTWDDYDSLPKPKPEIISRVLFNLGVLPQNFEEWLKSEWLTDLKDYIAECRQKLPNTLIGDLTDQITAFFTDLEDVAERIAKQRRADYHQALEKVVDQHLVALMQ